MKTLIAILMLLASGQACATIVRVDTPLGSFSIDLLEEQAPNTVANFLAYLRDGSYDNAIIHRSSHGFIVQGGGFTFADNEFAAVPTKPPVVNEFGLSNVRGTVAMAKVGGDPDSATSQWFVNVEDNSANLDGQNGGFTVFGQVLGNGMQLVDTLNSIARYNLDGSVLTEVPLLLSGAIETVTAENVLFTRITEVTGFEINAGLSGAWFNAATAGQGWLVDVIDSGDRQEIFLAWFTYDVNAPTGDDATGFGSTQHRWLTASGSFAGDTAMLTLFRNTGGIFNDGTPTTLEAVGTMTVQFLDCGNAQLSWNFDDDAFADDSVSIVRLSPDKFCEPVALPAG